MPVRQSRTSARITACGRDSGVRAGYVARATAAASAIASPPAIRVVFLVANTGKPSGGPPAGTSSPVCPETGGVVGASAGGVSSPPPQPARKTQSAAATAHRERTKTEAKGSPVGRA